ncbi:V-ATPase V1 sector subunit E [Yamadazyma tenuis]|uniref:ATPase, V1/A1 complex, subunit E n=1 Tax=Candida tenuis (strain ATCC 10573 / BCRC 21748 / CBS 615 / JCM 9827 / NBRC 10315 / NRRL Y-1498 / VKM Y-70) TaxID=590646 RepID=G3B608_CANTC|nr:ATPase, V1/A1 complex, subunit E [Yamadazyma tenuis ATCC 10573]EGV63351.1 ATPase, V1/A1 complex, subunit E [Yamadazyma tenuis ATCC 10573]WEJ96824.1 V-ATPase V1 sector subunit E [Yamadazyma tenuis]
MSLTDDQVNAELRKMKAFIEKEAQEKAKEIKLKADEEYEIEKASIVRSETAAIDAAYEQKFKKASLAQQITKSTIANKTRLRILATKEEVLDQIFDEAKTQLNKISANKGEYKAAFVGLIEEGLFTLLEEEVTIKVREADLSLAKEVVDEVTKDFEEKAKFPIKVFVDESDFLSKDCAGGVVVINKNGKIEVNNTLDERLKLLSEEALPGLRLELFGISETRKYFD